MLLNPLAFNKAGNMFGVTRTPLSTSDKVRRGWQRVAARCGFAFDGTSCGIGCLVHGLITGVIPDQWFFPAELSQRHGFRIA
jgi:hypothetical protein